MAAMAAHRQRCIAAWHGGGGMQAKALKAYRRQWRRRIKLNEITVAW